MKQTKAFAARLGLCFAALVIVAALFVPACAYADDGDYITVRKVWQHGSVPESERAQSVTVSILADGAELTELTLTAEDAAEDGSWTGSIGPLPRYNEYGEVITYTVAEPAVEGYTSAVTRQPKLADVLAFNWGGKITPASTPSYALDKSNLVAANKGGSYYVWTRDTLTDAERARLIDAINAAGLQGFGKALAETNTEFQSGLPAQFSSGSVSLREEDGGAVIYFAEPRAWSLFYAGTLVKTEAQAAEITNTADTVPTPEPTDVPTPTPVPTIPKTADAHDIMLWAALALISGALSVPGLTALWRKE